jgi:hypothetical protein
VFKNKVLRRIIGSKRHEVTGGLRKLHEEELHNLYCSPNIIRMMKSNRMRWAGHVARMGGGRMRRRRRMHIEFWWESQNERPLGRHGRRWENNIKMVLREIGWGDLLR